MSLAAAKSELLAITATEPAPKIVRYLGIVVSVAQRQRMGNEQAPGSKKAKLAKLLSITGLVEQIPGLLPNGANLMATGCQSLIFHQEDSVAKYPIDSIGTSDDVVDAYLDYERYCLDTMRTVFGDGMLPATQPNAGNIHIRPFGILGSAVISQELVDIAYDLFSDEGLWMASDTQEGSKLHTDLVRLLDGARLLRAEHGVHLDAAGANNIVITDKGEIKIIDYDPNQHADELVHAWEHEAISQKIFAIESLQRAIRY